MSEASELGRRFLNILRESIQGHDMHTQIQSLFRDVSEFNRHNAQKNINDIDDADKIGIAYNIAEATDIAVAPSDILTPLQQATIPQLKRFASLEGITLRSRLKKSEMLETIYEALIDKYGLRTD